MANIKSQIKRIETNNKARALNSSHLSRLRTAIKKTRKLAEDKKVESFNESLPKTISLIDKSQTKGIISFKSAGHKKRALYKLANSLNE